MTRVGRIAKGIGAFVLLVALVVGIPFALWHFVGWPLPHHLPSWSGLGHDLGQHGIPDRTLVDALAVAVWLTWAVLLTSVVAEIPAAIGGRTARRLPFAGAFQPLTGRLIATLLVAVLAMSPRPTHAGAASLGGIARAGGHQPVTALVLTDATAAVLTSSMPLSTTPRAPVAADDAVPVGPPATSNVAERTYVVKRGDTLWGIAERELGDPLRWSELYRLNVGRPQPGGRTLTDANWIDPGWTLVLPASPAATPSTPTPSPSPTTHVADPPSTTTPPVTTAPTTTEPARATPPASVAPPVSTSHAHTPSHNHEAERHGALAAPVRLPSGSIVGGSFAFGILSALALARLRRRHAYRYRPPEAGRHLGADPLRPTLRALAIAVQPVEAEDEEQPERLPIEIVAVSADEDADHRERPDLIDVGTRDGEPVAISLSELAGVVLRGPDTEDVTRAWVAALLVRAGPLAAEVLTTETAVERLVPGAGAGSANGEVPGIRVVANNDAVLCLLEAEVLARSRQLEADGALDILTYRHTYPWDPLPTVVALIDEVSVMHSERWAAVCASGGRLGLGAIVLAGDSPSGVQIALDANRLVVEASPEHFARRLDGVRCFVLRPEEAADVFMTLIEVERRPSSDDDLDASPADAELAEEAWPTSVPPNAEAMAMSEEASRLSPVEVTSEEAPPIAVRLFGPYEIVVDGETVASGLRGVARELLAWYLLRPEGASIGAAVEACWPNTDPVEVSTKFWRAASDLRKRVGRMARPETQLLVQVGDVYRLDPDAIDCDLWQFQAALADATHANSDGATRDALRRAVPCYRGDFVENADYRWVEPAREDLRHRALDAHLRLAELEEQLGAPDAAEEVLGRAIELDRYAEEPYRRLMTLQGEHDRRDAVAATWRLLERRLAEIDVDPEPATARLHRLLTTDAAPAGSSRRV